MIHRRPEDFDVPLLNYAEILVAIDMFLADSSGTTPQTRLTSLERMAAELEVRIVALREHQ